MSKKIEKSGSKAENSHHVGNAQHVVNAQPHVGNAQHVVNAQHVGNAHHIGHTHSDEEYAALIARIARISGHVNSIREMMEDKRDCTDILIQISAVKGALNSLGKLILKNHIDACLETAEEYKEDRDRIMEDLNKAIDQFVR